MFRRKISLTGTVLAALEALRTALEVEEGARIVFCSGLDINPGLFRKGKRTISIKGEYKRAATHTGGNHLIEVDLVMENHFGWLLPDQCEIHYDYGGRRHVRWGTRYGRVIAIVTRVALPSGNSWVGYGYASGERWEEPTCAEDR